MLCISWLNFSSSPDPPSLWTGSVVSPVSQPKPIYEVYIPYKLKRKFYTQLLYVWRDVFSTHWVERIEPNLILFCRINPRLWASFFMGFILKLENITYSFPLTTLSNKSLYQFLTEHFDFFLTSLFLTKPWIICSTIAGNKTKAVQCVYSKLYAAQWA